MGSEAATDVFRMVAEVPAGLEIDASGTVVETIAHLRAELSIQE